MSASVTFFSTTELLESTLANLDLRELLLAPRVPRNFRDTVTGSPKLLEALHLASPAGKPIKLVYKTLGTLPIPAPRYVTNDATEKQVAITQIPVFNILCKDKIDPDSFDSTRVLKTTEAYMRPEASWRSMFLTSSPVPTIGYMAIFRKSATSKKREVQEFGTRNSGDLTLGQLIDEVMTHKREGETVVKVGLRGQAVW